MHRLTVVTNERRGYWAGQLRHRLADRPVRWRETRGTADLLAAIDGPPSPVVVIDLGPRAAEGLERLVQASVTTPSALILALDPDDRLEVRRLARECGATCLWSGFAPPPRVAALIDRWLSLARARVSQAGRASLPEPEPDPSDPLTMLEA